VTQSANNVGGGGTIGQSFLGSLFGGAPAQQVSATPYDSLLAQANAASGQYGALGAPGGYTQTAPTISNPYQGQSRTQLQGVQNSLGQVGALDMATAQGQGPALAALTAGTTAATDQSIAAQTAMARSATGGASQQAAAQLAGQGNAVQAQGAAAAQNVQNLSAAELGAAGQAAGVYGTQGSLAQAQYNTEQEQAQAQAQIAQQNQAQQNAMSQYYTGAGIQEQGQGLNSLNSYNNAVAGAEGQATASNNTGTSSLGQLTSTASTLGGAAAASDERVKNDVTDEGVLPQGSHGSMADDFLDKLHPKSFRYNSPGDEMNPSAPSGGKYLGVMAQDLVRTRDVGPQMVSKDPRGALMVEQKPTLSAALAGLGRLNERVRAMEAQGGARGR
jgi:hypothetical protein